MDIFWNHTFQITEFVFCDYFWEITLTAQGSDLPFSCMSRPLFVGGYLQVTWFALDQ